MNKLDSSPLFVVLFISTLISYLFSTLAFIVSKWYAMYPGSQSTFQNIGLWEICFNSFMSEDTYNQLFNDCFYVQSPEIRDLYSWIITNWFLASQITYTLSYIGLMIAALICLLMFLGLLNIKHKRNVFMLLVLNFISSVTCLITLILFGVNTKDLKENQWMPNPTQCSLSWSYGSASLSLLTSMISFGILSHVLRSDSNGYIQWTCGKKSKYEPTFVQSDVGVSMSNIGASIYDPRGTSTESRVSKDRDRSVISAKLELANRDLSKNNKSSHPKTTASPNDEINRPVLYSKRPQKQEKYDASILSGKSEQTTDSKKFGKVSSQPASQLSVTSINASSTVIAAKPMKRK